MYTKVTSKCNNKKYIISGFKFYLLVQIILVNINNK